MKFLLEKKTSLFYILSIITLTTILLIYYLNSQKSLALAASMLLTQKVIGKNNEVLIDAINIETRFRGFLLSHNEKLLEPYFIAKSKVFSDLDALRIMTKNIPNQQSNILKQNLSNRITFNDIQIASIKTDASNEAEKILIIEKGKILTDKIRIIIAQINNEEFKLLAGRKIENEKNNQFSQLLFIFLILFIGTIFIFGLIIIKNQKEKNNRLETITATEKIASQYSLSLIEASLDPLFTISTEGKITDTNQASVRVTDASKENLIGSDFITYFTDPEKAKKGYEEVFSKGFVVDYPLTLKDGKLTPVLFNGSIYKDTNNNIIGAVVVARDITKLKKAESELLEAKIFAELATAIAEEAQNKAEKSTKIAEDAVKAKQQFLSNMSHEIRTPMNAIIGFTKVILKTNLSNKQKEYLSAIQMSGDALIVLINDILDLAKVDAGKMVFEKVPFKMHQSIKAMLHVFETKIQEKNLELITQYDNAIPEVLLGDPVRLNQIILNLVSNAVKFTTNGNITVSVRLLSEDTEKVTVEFEVADTGIGISKDKIAGIFENFQQASSNTSRLYGGTGLGLAIAKQLVEPQGGTISVKSEVGEGSSFSFRLNFVKTNSEAEIETAILELNLENNGVKVLVVEDMALNQLLMKTVLNDFGFDRDIAENGQIAIDKLKAKSYDIILMDLQMPIMNGFEATEYIRKTMNSKIPIIALTADVTTVDLAKCKAVGMNDYIAKPVDERLLYSKIIGLVKKPMTLKGGKSKNQKTSLLKKTKCIDLNYLAHRTKSNPQLMMEMISIYLEQTPPLIMAMKQSLLDKDYNLLNASMHKIIPSFSIMGINTDFEDIARKIEGFTGAQQHTESVYEMAIKLENICAQAYEELAIEYNIIKNTLS
jgi:PAS domain S-box-containing protein